MLSNVDIRYFKDIVGYSNIGKESANDISARCPICGDSKKSKNKKRLHLYNKEGDTGHVNCFNGDCSCHNKTMYSFIRDFYPDKLPQYRTETFGLRMNDLKDSVTLKDSTLKDIAKEISKPVITHDLSPYMKHLKDSDEGLMYLRNRGISYRPQKYKKWYIGTQDLKIDDTLYKITDNIVIPLYYEDEMYGFYSRSIKDKEFITYMDDKNIGYKLWNFFNLDLNEPVYIFEGIFDAISSGKTNILATMGAKLTDDRLKEIKHPVFCLDNDRTGIMNMIEYCKKGYDVFVPPNNLKEKDMNEMMLNHPELNMSEVISNNVYTGMMGITRLRLKIK